jgi:uptake hydrogenase large subunit
VTKHIQLEIALNRVEGDLELRIEIEDGVVVDAWSSGTMYRGFENILNGRGALDGLVITPRICGICSTTHLMAAARALDAIAGVTVPDDALRIRNLALMVEHIQSDMRHAFLLFAPDLLNAVYRDHPLANEAKRRYAPLQGERAIETIQQTKKVLQIVAILGGQWPHSSFMVPGGVVSMPGTADLLQCRHLLADYCRWYERRILGCSLERWLDVNSVAELDNWLEENESQRESEVGFFVRFARAAGLDRLGAAHNAFLSYGSLDIPVNTAVQLPPGPRSDGVASVAQLVPAGFAVGSKIEAFDQHHVAEHVAHSWYLDYVGGRHPSQGETQPYASGAEGQQYSWSKAPRYQGAAPETGPLAEMVIAGTAFFTEMVAESGANVLARQLARLARPATLLPAMDIWLRELAENGSHFYELPGEIEAGDGFGLLQATRGALGHWVRIEDSRIAHYQIVTPTAWNGSPRDSDGNRGPWEEAVVGTPVRDVDNPVEVEHVIRSFDPCLVCTVHAVPSRRR